MIYFLRDYDATVCNSRVLGGPFKTSSYRFHPPIFRHQRFSTSATRLNSFRTANTAPCPGFQNDPTSSYLRAPSRFSRGVLEGKESREGIQGRGGDPTSELKRSLLNTTQEANLKKS